MAGNTTTPKETEKRSKNQEKIFNDPIWGPIKLHPACVKIIDTPEFQRLRFIKQLGGCSFVYPGACHTRFEHSIGTSHLAGLLVRTLRDNMNPDYKIDINERDILCVEIAGLCHDLGHGAFSHLFDSLFIPRTDKNSKWTHEEASVKMLDRIFDSLEKRKEDVDLDLEEDSPDRKFIRGLIRGEKVEEIEGKKEFLFEIVANKKNSIDVDKWDYFTRDCHMLGLKHNFQIMRSIMLARVNEIEKKQDNKHYKEYHISFPKTEYMNIFDMFHARYTLHRCAYQHPVNKAVELMITDALVLANEELKYRKGNGQGEKLSDTIKYMDAYMLVTDSVIDRIRFENVKDEHGKVKEAKEIIDRIFRRDLYKCERKSGMERRVEKTEEEDGETNVGEDEKTILQHITSENIHVEPIDFNYGAEDENPMDNVYFYGASASDDENSAMLPKAFQQIYLRMYWKKSSNEGKEAAIRSFKNLKEITLKGKRYIFESVEQQETGP